MDYTDDEAEFLRAIDAFRDQKKRTMGSAFPTWTEVLAVVRSLGYAKVLPNPPAFVD